MQMQFAINFQKPVSLRNQIIQDNKHVLKRSLDRERFRHMLCIEYKFINSLLLQESLLTISLFQN